MNATKDRTGKFTALGAHIYAGGFTLGVQAAGFHVLGHLEEWTFGVDTVKKNLGLEVRVGPDRWQPEEFRRKVAWLYANPPCASWSQAGVKINNKAERNNQRWKHDGRTQCTELVFSLIPVIQPKVFTWESVAAATTNGAPFVEARTQEVMAQGYHVYQLLFNGKDCGLPQSRKRFFFVASKVKLDFSPPHHAPVTVRDAWRGMPAAGARGRFPPNPMELKILKLYPKNWETLKAQDRRLWRFILSYWEARGIKVKRKPNGKRIGVPGFLHERLRYDYLAPTILGGPHVYHPKELRALTVKEQQLLCGYPYDYEFVGPNPYGQIAKAVLPPPARWLGLQVRQGLERNRRVRVGATRHDFRNNEQPLTITIHPEQEQ